MNHNATIDTRRTIYEMRSFQMDLLAFVANARVVSVYAIIIGILLAASIIRNLHVEKKKTIEYTLKTCKSY